MGKKKWRDNWFYEYLVGEKGRMELVGLGYFLPRLTKMFSSWIEDKTDEKTITKDSDQKAPVHSSNHVKAPMQYCNVSFFFLFFPLVFFFGCLFSYSFVLFYFIFISFRFLLFFLGCCLFQVLFIHSKFFFFFFHLFWFLFFFGSSYFCFPLICYFYFYFYLIKVWE